MTRRLTDGALEPGPADVWALDTHSYSADKFYTKSTDGRGNSELIQVKVSPFLNGTIAEMVESPTFPDYRTRADFIRDAVVHRIAHVRAMENDPRRMEGLRHKTQMLMSEALADRLKAEMEQHERYTTSLIEIMEMAIASGNVTSAGLAIEQAEGALEVLPFNHADKLRGAIAEAVKKYGYLKARARLDAGEIERHS